ncbi:Dps family protein [Loigolactobacillus rennini]|uniref:DNA-binding ferritin-like protein (Oxidative damage protectant) n=2 Tax=Loigolactobacillus rennini TaxID=238013 RepID=A0A0R2D179_9LACO|nr:Dps family protein [Loigolactobacillus rennini]KRM97745.1 DNA-binding ferritin-like protein (oxidative damage protectant) [Loigolactobacillus rennini DSM 20253]SFZ88710.1 Non-specific DNA-binding protein Dps / Iron-binding ferritin-like antioxidant protein / Ferroxidase [Loigolactobacillus rennini]
MTTYNYDFPKTKAQLNQLIADISQLKVIIQQTHWYLRGQSFFRLHPLMDDYGDQLSDQLDEVAERLIAINGAPMATTHEFIENTGLPDEKVEFDQLDMKEFMARLVKGFKYLRDQYQKGIEITDEEQDLPTQDMLNGYKSDLDKNIWMLNAYLDKAPYDD